MITGGERVISLLSSHGERLYRLLVRMTLCEQVAEDLLQDLLVKLSAADGFVEADRPYAYARRAAVNLAFSWIRGRKRVVSLEADAQVAADSPPWLKLVEAEEIQLLLDHMESLADRDRTILVMRYFDEASYTEIGEAVGQTAHQVRGLCHKAIKRLRAVMHDADGENLAQRTEVKP